MTRVLRGMIVDGYTVSIETNGEVFAVVTQKFGSYETNGGFRSYQEAREFFNEEIEDIKNAREWDVRMGLR